MSELGVGVERFTLGDTDATASAAADVDGVDEKAAEREAEEARRRQERSEDVRAVEAMPVVVIKNFESRGGGARKAELLDALAQWAATLAENQVGSPFFSAYPSPLRFVSLVRAPCLVMGPCVRDVGV